MQINTNHSGEKHPIEKGANENLLVEEGSSKRRRTVQNDDANAQTQKASN